MSCVLPWYFGEFNGLGNDEKLKIASPFITNVDVNGDDSILGIRWYELRVSDTGNWMSRLNIMRDCVSFYHESLG